MAKKPRIAKPRTRKISKKELVKQARMKTAVVTCAFCLGVGVDRFQVLSPYSKCPVCHGRGIVRVQEPFETCGACDGTGVYFNSKLYCWPCHGKGVMPVREAS